MLINMISLLKEHLSRLLFEFLPLPKSLWHNLAVELLGISSSYTSGVAMRASSIVRQEELKNERFKN